MAHHVPRCMSYHWAIGRLVTTGRAHCLSFLLNTDIYIYMYIYIYHYNIITLQNQDYSMFYLKIYIYIGNLLLLLLLLLLYYFGVYALVYAFRYNIMYTLPTNYHYCRKVCNITWKSQFLTFLCEQSMCYWFQYNSFK